MEGDEHKIKNSIIRRNLTGSILKNHYRPIITNLCDSLVNELYQKKSFEFTSNFGKKFSLLTTFNLISISHERIDWFLERLSAIASFATGFELTEEKIQAALLASEELEVAILELISERRSHPGNDIISFIINKNDSHDQLSDSEIVTLSLNILLAASEPVDKVLANCIYYLYRNRNCIDHLAEGSCSYHSVVQESLRLSPPVHLIPRLIENNTCFEGINLKEGNLIFCLIPSANRDDKYFYAPNNFDPLRKFKRHISYGAGMHTCIGAQFANMQLSIALQKLTPVVEKYKEVKPPEFGGIYTRGATKYFLERI
ncbi:cytochrome P450 [Vreelandella gomseomensis]|uniref:Cytochrome P450 n=1 Tax=Vreelandella gomseomensis TaxID=370766 RepID=A0ABU1GAV8_9GAMM|nr:cytochrome P450 [Halomonas gomseomensis]MDR5874629.1 cytochrome P450 [Halomonas gomseomensis]